MSRKRKRKPNRTERLRRQEQREKLELEVVIEDTASTYTCSHEMAADLLWQAEHAMEQLEGDLFFNQLAVDIWRGHEHKASELIRSLTDLIAERERHRLALSSLRDRFSTLEEAELHEHLEPEETYLDLVRHRLKGLGDGSVQSEEQEGRPSNSDGS